MYRSVVPPTVLLFVAMAASSPVGAYAQSMQGPVLDAEALRLEAAMDTALQAYAERIQRTADSVAPQDEPPPPISGFGTIRWDRRSMDIPEVRVILRRRDMVFAVPQVTMAQRSFSFDVPETRMVRKEVGCTPRTKVEWRGNPIKRPHVTNWCQPNYTNIPEIRMVTRRVSTSIAEVALRPQQFSISLPESRVSMKRISWNWPEYISECSAINSDACRAEERRQAQHAADTERRVTAAIVRTRGESAQEAARHVSAFFSYQRTNLLRQHSAMAEVLKTSVRQMEAALELMKSQGAENSTDALEIRAQILQLQQELPTEMERILEIVADLSSKEAEIIRGLSDEPAPAES